MMAVLDPVKVTLTNLDGEKTLSLPYWPHDVVRDSPDGLVGMPGGGRVAPRKLCATCRSPASCTSSATTSAPRRPRASSA
ncbi:hypothetical protein MSS93_06860 [Deinococcus radiodurans]|nr:hypothetical protein MSS93_06860 [Deinococcus radiodurans]